MNHSKANKIARHLKDAYGFTPPQTFGEMTEIFSRSKGIEDLAEELWDAWSPWDGKCTPPRDQELTFEEWLETAKDA